MSTFKTTAGTGSRIKISRNGTNTLKITATTSNNGFNPISLGGLKAWYKADALVGINNGDPVTLWPDSSGIGNDIAGSAIYVASDSLLNNKPAVHFNNISIPSRLERNLISSINSFTLYSVSWQANYGSIAYFGDGVTGRFGFLPYTDGNVYANAIYSNAAVHSWSANTPIILSYPYPTGTTIGTNLFHYNGSNAGVAQLGSGETLGTMTSILLGSRYYTFGGYDFAMQDGNIAEVLVFDNAHDNTTRGLVESYLAEKYGITI
jgi:hypothetical protein